MVLGAAGAGGAAAVFARQPFEILADSLLPAGGRGVLHAAEDFLLDIVGRLWWCPANLEFPLQVLLDVAQALRQHLR